MAGVGMVWLIRLDQEERDSYFRIFLPNKEATTQELAAVFKLSVSLRIFPKHKADQEALNSLNRDGHHALST